ncbi:MAG TPA: hypothetical protein VM260_10580 [Pirellula sp.]|nr:hypothetical protein [Pirellula sp.]
MAATNSYDFYEKLSVLLVRAEAAFRPCSLSLSIPIMNADPLYLPSNANVAYPLNWSLSVFGKVTLPSPVACIDQLRESVRTDELKILEFLYRPPNVALFFVSSQPTANPSQIIRSIKGRWQNISRPTHPIEFRRNYRITAVGTVNSEVLDSYVCNQTSRHPMADTEVQLMIESIQFHDVDVDLNSLLRSNHGEYRYALHLVFESDGGWHEVRPAVLTSYRDAIIKSCSKHNWRLSRIGLLSNHLHILVGAGIEDSPNDVALAFLNNMAFVQGMKPVFRFSFFAGTYGEYDRGAIWNSMEREGDAASARTGRTESFPIDSIGM